MDTVPAGRGPVTVDFDTLVDIFFDGIGSGFMSALTQSGIPPVVAEAVAREKAFYATQSEEMRAAVAGKVLERITGIDDAGVTHVTVDHG